MSFRKISLGAVCVIGTGGVANPAEKGGRGCVVGNGKNQKCSSASGNGSWAGARDVCMSGFPRYHQQSPKAAASIYISTSSV